MKKFLSLIFSVVLINSSFSQGDEPCTATPLTPGATCSFTTYSLAGMTPSAGPPAPGCASFGPSPDAWFSIVVPASGIVILDGNNTGTITDGGMAAYSGANCNALTLISCNDDGSANGLMPYLNLTGLTAGSTIYVRIWDYSDGTGTFALCAQAGAAPPPPPPPGQGESCSMPNSFCSQPITYPAGTGGTVTAPVGPDYDCLGSQPNPAWFNMQVATSGDFTFGISAGSDIDFIIWGPFASPTGACLAGLTAGNVVDCSFSGTANEVATIPNATAGEYFIIMITNYSGVAQNIDFTQSGGVGAANCNILCNITGLTGTPGTCQLASNTYDVTGTITTTSPPTSGTLTISSSCGGPPVVLNPPFSTSMNYTLTGVPTTTGACTITAAYSADVSCTRTVTVNSPAPCGSCTMTASNTGPYCQGATISLTTTPVAGATYAWNGPNGFTATGQSVTIPNAIASMSGTYSVTATAGPAVCLTTTSVSVTATPIVTANSETICSGSSATITANGAATYSWAPATGLSATTGSVVTANPTATTTYTITGTTSSCVGLGNSTITVNPTPTVTVNSPTVCAGENAFLSASGATTYAWSPATNLSSTTGANVTSNSTVTIVYTVTGIDQGCSATATSTVTVNQTQNLIINTAAYCQGGSATLTASGATTYVWSPATGLSSTTGASVTANPTVTTIYSVVGTSAGCNATGSTTVTVNPNPIIDAGVNDTVCLGFSTAITATGGFSYLWSADPSLNSTTIASPTASPTVTTTYTVTGTDVNGCVGTDNVTILVPPTFTLTPTAINATCFASCNGAASVSATPSTGGFANYTYTWDNGSTAQIINGLCAGIYTVVVRDFASCVQSTSVTITEPTILSIAEASNTPVNCNGGTDGTASVNVSGGTAPYNYFWQPIGTTTASNNNLAAGTYSISAVDVNGCNSNTTITITEPQAISINPVTGNTICIGQNTNLTVSASGGTGAYTFAWTDGTNTLSGSTVNVSPTSTTSYTVSAIDANNCNAINTQSVTVIVNPPLTMNFISSYAICEGGFENVDVSGFGGSGTHTFSWNPMTGVTLLNASGSSAKLNPTSTTNYTVSINDNCGTPTADTNFVLTVNPKPVLSITPAVTSGCQPLEVNFTGTSSNIPVQCYWDFGGNGNSYNCNPTRVFSDDGNFLITYNVTDLNGCTNFVNSNVIVFPVPNAVFSASPQPTTIIDPELTFTNITDANIVSQTWFFNDSLGTNSILPTPSYIYPAPGEYLVTLAVETDKGCVDTSTQSVFIDDYFVVYVPNSFSPDNDGYNDTFTAYGTGITSFKMGIYDRWGGKIIETDDIEKGWDGKKSNSKVEKGIYIYRIEVINFLGEKKLYSGHVTVVR